MRIPTFLPQQPHFALFPKAVRPVVQSDRVHFGQQPDQPDSYPLVIVGGGLAGMTAAYLAHQKGLKTLLLEENNRLGGNANTGYHNTINRKKLIFPVGASVLAVANDSQRRFFKELGVDVSNPQYKIQPDIVHYNGEWAPIAPNPDSPLKPPAWTQEFQSQVDQFIRFLRNALQPRKGASHFPLRTAPPEIFEWDKINLKTLLEAWPDKVKAFFATGLRSDISEDLEQVSALAGMIDQAADMGERVLLPGGNHYLIRQMMKSLKDQKTVQILKDSKVLDVRDQKTHVSVQYLDSTGHLKRVKAKNVLMGIPAHRIPEVVKTVSPEQAKLLRGIRRGSYALMNIFLDHSPLQSNTYYIFPDTKWVADVVQTNERLDPMLPPGAKVPSVLTCYIAITSQMKKEMTSQKQLMGDVLKELSQKWPWLEKSIRGTRLTYYPEAMSAPAPGQMTQIRDFNPWLTPRIRNIHSDLSGTFAARGAIDEAMTALEELSLKERDSKKDSKEVVT